MTQDVGSSVVAGESDVPDGPDELVPGSGRQQLLADRPDHPALAPFAQPTEVVTGQPVPVSLGGMDVRVELSVVGDLDHKPAEALVDARRVLVAQPAGAYDARRRPPPPGTSSMGRFGA